MLLLNEVVLRLKNWVISGGGSIIAKEILINQLFAGKYLNEGENIGHEVINLFRDDDGNNNLYITPSGSVKGHDLQYILFVRNVTTRKTVEVIGVAKELRQISDEEVKQVRYAGVSLDQIFSKNVHSGKKDPFTNHITFRAGEFLLPEKRIFISLDNESDSKDHIIHLNSERQVIIPQGMREYYSEKIDSTAYVQLIDLIENAELWKKQNTTEKLFPDGPVQNQSPSFLEVIRKEDDENIFSNLLGYYFDYSHRAFQKFASAPNLLNIPDMSVTISIYRETIDRVDLWIESDQDIIVIENKIKSGINGIIGEDKSQLNKYYIKAKKEALKNNKRPHFYIFAPDYAKFDLSRFGPEIEASYKVIRYSDIYKFFVIETETFIADRVFPDFLRGLKRHTLSFSELQFNTMRSRLLKKINMLQ